MVPVRKMAAEGSEVVCRRECGRRNSLIGTHCVGFEWNQDLEGMEKKTLAQMLGALLFCPEGREEWAGPGLGLFRSVFCAGHRGMHL